MIEDSRIDLAGGDTRPVGSEVAGTAHIDTSSLDEVRNAELSILWFTEGKGDTDRQVIHFETLDPQRGPDYPFTVQLPLLPVSYTGRLLKVHWVVRLRLDPRHGTDLVIDRPFTVVPAIP